MIRVGPAGWAYKDWEGIVYPKPKPRGFDPVAYLARHFDTIEINSSFYGPPRSAEAKAWAEHAGGNPRFRFTAKLYQAFTHDRKATQQDEADFKNGIAPLMEAERLGALLMQFPWSFRNEPENRIYLRRLRDRFADYPPVVEVRHSSWIEPDVLDELAESGVGALQHRSASVPSVGEAGRAHHLGDRLRAAPRAQLSAVVLQASRRAGSLRLFIYGSRIGTLGGSHPHGRRRRAGHLRGH